MEHIDPTRTAVPVQSGLAALMDLDVVDEAFDQRLRLRLGDQPYSGSGALVFQLAERRLRDAVIVGPETDDPLRS